MLIFIKGSDSFLAREAIGAVKKKYFEKNQDGVELIEVDATEPMRSWADLKASPLFSTSRLIIIKRAGELLAEEQNNLASILTDLPASSVVVIWDAKPLKANSPLWARTHNAPKTISVEPLTGLGLKSWVRARATVIGFETTAELVSELVSQYGSDLWAIQTDLQARCNDTATSSWGAERQDKPFILFEYIRAGQWVELKKHLIAGYRRGVAIELTVGSLAAAIRQNIRDQRLKRTMTQILTEVDIGVKSGLIEAGDAVALLTYYLPDGQKRVQWECQWEQLT